jgi:aspartate carbamoyltransferase regulatory subunit
MVDAININYKHIIKNKTMKNPEKQITVSLPCPNCISGTMEYTGADFATNPRTYKHVCASCGYISKYTKKYPHVKA